MPTPCSLGLPFVGPLSLGLLYAGSGACQEAPGDAVLRTDSMEYVVGANGSNLSLSDPRTRQDFLAKDQPQPFAIVDKGGQGFGSTACSYRDGRLTCSFGPSGVTVVIQVTARPRYLVFEVQSVSDPAVERVAVGVVRLTQKTHYSDTAGIVSDGEYAVAGRSLNLQGNVTVAGMPVVVFPSCTARYGLVGARFALVGCPAADLRQILQEVVRQEGLPYSPLGGPFALDAQENRGSYLFATPSEKDVDAWIEMAKLGGFAEVHVIGWNATLGHYEPRRDLYPGGLAGLKSVVDRIHAAGMKAGMHTLTGCITADDPWVTPVPDRRLVKDATLALAAPLTAGDGTVLTTAAPPPGLVSFWSDMGTGNTVQIGDEIIAYKGISREPPFGFTGCTRGHWGTRPAAHDGGARVEHLCASYCAYIPDEDSTLVDELADCIAKVYNTCGFDMIYMDGAEGMRTWHAIAKMRRAIFTRLQRPALVEASCWDSDSWVFHSRIGAWDHPKYGFKRFADLHFKEMAWYHKSVLLPGQVGWWVITGPAPEYDAEGPDDMEYLAAKCLGWNAPMSLQGIAPGATPANARQPEYLAMLGRYERLRLAGHFGEAVREKLRVPGDEFHLEQATDGGWQLVPTDYLAHRVTSLTDGSRTWTARNRFATQPVKLRIQALYSPEPYDSPQAVVVADFGNVAEEFKAGGGGAPGVKLSLSSTTDPVKVGKASAVFWARNEGKDRLGAWAHADKVFDPGLNAGDCGAIGVWVHGDGKGELLNLQLHNPPDYYPGWGDHYVRVDFTGWRYFEFPLRERDVEEYATYAWPYDLHGVYRFPLLRSRLGGFRLFYNDLPPGAEVTCHLSPVKALPVAKVKLTNPALTVGGKRLVFPVALESGQYLEFASLRDCRVRDERGEIVAEVTPQGQVPDLAAGDNTVVFDCQGPDRYNARAKVSVISAGEPLR